MARYRKCVFCEKSDSPPDTEDVLAKWIAREFSGGAKAKFHIRRGHDLDSPERQFYTRGHLGIVTSKPCRRCNNTWMSGLEMAVQPLFRPMMQGRAVLLTVPQQRTICEWLLKTTIMYEFATGRSPRFFKPIDRKAFYESRYIHQDTFMYLGRFKGTHSLWSTDADVTLTVRPNTTQAAPMPAYTATFVLNQLALQIFSFRRPEQENRSRISIKIPGDWDTAQLRVFPPWRDCRWPPEFAFDDAGIELFAHRWDTVMP